MKNNILVSITEKWNLQKRGILLTIAFTTEAEGEENMGIYYFKKVK